MKMVRILLQLYEMAVSKRIVGHVPLIWSRVVSKLLQFTYQDDWKVSQSWCWTVTRNTYKLPFYDDAKIR